MANPNLYGADTGAGAMSIVGTVLDVFGTLQSGRAARENADRQRVAEQFAAQQAEQQAGQAMASAQGMAMEMGRQGELTASRALAVISANGGGTMDPSMVNTLANVKGQTAFNMHNAIYSGEMKARQLRLQAASHILAGDFAEQAGAQTQLESAYSAGGKLVRGASDLYARSLYDKYGNNGPAPYVNPAPAQAG